MSLPASAGLHYVHVDVFSERPFSGNSLPVFPAADGLSTDQMVQVTRELRHFEAAFLTRSTDPVTVRARVFDLVGELPFAGHPVIGAAVVVHRAAAAPDPSTWRFELTGRTVTVEVTRTGTGFHGRLDQGAAEFFDAAPDRAEFADLFGLHVDDLDDTLPLEVGSTGLRYLVVPVSGMALDRARVRADLTEALTSVGAEFAVLLNDRTAEIRHWNNDGIVEDVATGSAAGVIGAYRVRHRRVPPGLAFSLHQGRFAGRPSVLTVEAHGSPEKITSVKVGGHVSIVGQGTLVVLP